ncbi:site-specific DNA-methyltransferase [Maribellus comscasis]|uniref:site-specific DNA-methyltransferase (adenine-specific) n=1 Tax=Maribellus comscasis TaxID=2681766 RepID=A0A6I6K8Y8_9BACT|nr:site-specific DNA-methyltransferase [Maribellus comscasis]
MEKLDLTTPDLVNENFEKIAALFPNCVTESTDGKAIDFDLLKQELNHAVVEGNKERYRLEWPGKREAIVTANLPSTKTLRPVREDSVDFDNTENLYIEGDNLEVLKLLQESYLGKIKMIYIDPPYNTGNDFVYKDNFKIDSDEYKDSSGQRNEFNERLVANPETGGRYHSDWLSMMYPRLKLARNLLSQDGVIFISIGQDELDNVTKVLNEVFGETNRLGLISRQMKTGGGSQGKYFSHNLDYILVYGKMYDEARYFRGEISKELKKKVYNQKQEQGERKGEYYRSMGLYQSSLDIRPGLRYWIECPDGTLVIPPGDSFPKTVAGEKTIPVTADGVWRWSYKKYSEELAKGNIEFKESKNGILLGADRKPSKWNVYTKIWLKDRESDGQIPSDLTTKFENRHSSKELGALGIPFDFAKPTSLINYLIDIMNQDDDITILDFFSGSATTADSVIQMNSKDNGKRKFILVQIPELTDEKSKARKAGYKNICEIGKERISRAGKQIETTLREKQKAKAGEIDFENSQTPEEDHKLDIGFRVFKLDSSNMQDVYYKPQDYKQDKLELFEDNVKPNRTADDLLVQVMLDWGLPLSLKIERKEIKGKQVFKVAENSLFACFDNGIDEEFAKIIAKEEPLRIVFKDSGFKDDTAKVNVKQLLKQLSPETEMKVI